MGKYIQAFQEIAERDFNFAGGKGKMLARLYQKGYPVPAGFIIFPTAFENCKLKEEAREEVNEIFKITKQVQRYAVRSSALSEDSAQASFAGEFETVLNVRTVEEIIQAANKVNQSGQSERVKVYSEVHGFDEKHDIAVVVQEMVPAEFSGVLFTVDPVSESEETMAGNFVQGVGEKLVSGEANPESFVLEKNSGEYSGPAKLEKYAGELLKLGKSLEEELNCPQDIEWAITEGKLYLLQSRPITTLKTSDPVMGNWNESKEWNFLWTSANAGEALPEVVTPATWSIWDVFHNQLTPIEILEEYPSAGLIGGRSYFNVSLIYSIYKMIMKEEDARHKTEEALGKIPEGVEIPGISFSKLLLVKTFIKNIKWEFKYKKLKKGIPEYIDKTPDWCKRMISKIQEVSSKEELSSLWQEEIEAYLIHSLWMLRAAMKLYSEPAENLRKKLTELLGEEDANTLLSNINQGKELASLGLVLGLSKVDKGQMTEIEFMEKYGHRAPNEFELSEPRFYEKEGWLDKKLNEFKNNSVDIKELLEKQRSQFEVSWKRLKYSYPEKKDKIHKKIEQIAEKGRKREGVRSEITRVIAVVRQFYLKAGELSGIADQIFFLSYDEVLKLLASSEGALKYISRRRRAYKKYKSLPDYPTFIKGSFDPFEWAADPERSSYFYDNNSCPDHEKSQGKNSEESGYEDSNYIKGFAGSAGKVEGIVKIISSPEQGEDFKKGEILVTTKTNIGWTPFFPVAAAIITDVGAPLSHAAIVARELGIPAVVGCGDATERLKTGDRVIVDGGKGTVRKIEKK